MVLIIGGASQGKLQYVLTKTGDVSVAEDFSDAGNCRVFNRFHLAVRGLLTNGGDPESALDEIMRQNPGIIIICDEIGGGVVPADPEGRAWREAVGRLCFKIAERADFVERVFCGLPMRLKGEGEWK